MDKKELRKKKEEVGIEILQENMEKRKKKKGRKGEKKENIRIQVQCYKSIRIERVLDYLGMKNKQI